MLVVISPSKSVMKQQQPKGLAMTDPIFSEKTAPILSYLQGLSEKRLTSTLEVSSSLGKLNYDRYQSWDDTEQRAALWMYSGDVYNGVDAYSMTDDEVKRAQKSLLIVSGLYGLLRPLDRIKPYRLEMRLPIKIGRNKNLYEYWQEHFNSYLEKSGEKLIVLCASPE